MERTLDDASFNGLSNEAIEECIKNKAEAELRDTCIAPLEKFAGPDIPHATISSEYQYSNRFMLALKCNTAAHKDHKETLTRLIQITENCVGLHSTPEAVVMTSIAQRVHPGLKIKASIE
jgi:hypothetical protein